MEHIIEPVTAVTKEQGQSLSMVGDSYRIVISGDQTQGAYAVIDMLVPPGGGPGPHAHADFQETFHVLEGEIEVKSEKGKFTAGTGTFVNIPLGGIVHCFKNNSDRPARLWCVVVPAGLEKFFQEIGQPAPFGTFLPPPPMDAASIEKLKTIAEAHGQLLYPPDYLDK